MVEGWILDVDANYEDSTIDIWIKTENGVKREVEDGFYPSFFVYSPEISELDSIYSYLQDLGCIDHLGYESHMLSPYGLNKNVLRVSLNDYRSLLKLANKVDLMGDFRLYELFNVDISIPIRYMLEKDIFPLGYSTLNGDLRCLDDIYSIDYLLPPLKCVEVGVEVKKKDKIPTFDDPILSVSFDDCVLEGGDETDLLAGLKDLTNKFDPDIIYTDGGDTFVLPYLYHRAEVNESDDFYLGRLKNNTTVQSFGRSYFSYGRVGYRPPRQLLRGRLHIDRASSFIYAESGLSGVVELARLSRIPIQTQARITPGTSISAMQICHALKEDTLVMWKKNLPENFKTAEKLFLSDRGAMIYDPIVGVHEDVIEIDFTSLFPNIMVKYNISPETVLCDCCNSKKSVPVIDYNICERQIGLIPRVLEPIIWRRGEYKKRMHDDRYREYHDTYKYRSKALKWLLVTCFGYTGYRNARFGRIECHEVINAYAREILVKSTEVSEALGYEVLHGIVDSLWLKSCDPTGDPEDLILQITNETGLPIEIEGTYRWIVFLLNKTNNVGALNRYYGLLDTGEMKIRGVEIRRRDMCALIKAAQTDVLRELSLAEDTKGLYEKVPSALEILKSYAVRLKNGDCKLEELVFRSTVSKELEYYAQFNNNVASLLQLSEYGIVKNPGESVRYIITDSRSRRYSDRVKAWELASGDEKYDADKYVSYLVRAAASILSPFGYTERGLADYLKSTTQCTLSSFIT
ncbi:MAG: DNA polymerase domain-containing protein [Halobacteriota archaeon]|nr:DNA polymerase domain-containing protein [Halobacteriota archaeon]